MSVKLIIKSAAQSLEDFSLSCNMSWTIARVKDEISSLYPTKPKREQQKLIYGGKLLPDHLTLEAALNKNQEVHILHIVCPFPVTDSKKTEAANKTLVPPVPEAPLLNPSAVYSQINPNVLPTSYPSMPGLTNGTVPDMTQQYLAMQQMYMQMMTQYFTQYNGSNTHGQVNASVPVAPQPEPVAARQGIPLRQAENNRRDYIDHLFTFSRWIMMAALLLAYSSFSRVMAVLGMVLMLTMFAKMNRQHQQEARERERAETVRPEQPSEPTENDETPGNLEETEPRPEPQPVNPPATSVPSTVYAIISAFFSSLVPTAPIPVNAN